MIKKVVEGIWKIIANSNIYLLMLDEPILIDAGDRKFRTDIIKDIRTIIDPMNIKKILLTHLHYDHIGNIDLFPNAEVYAHKEAIMAYKDDPFGSILNEDNIEKNNIILYPLPQNICGLEIIETPGHADGSVCFFLKDKKIMFSGDTLFFGGGVGRTDLPTSRPRKIEESLAKIMSYDYDILCPGHEY